MKAISALALVGIGTLCFVAPMSAHARGGGGHSGNSGAHAGSQNHPAATKSQTTTKNGDKQPHQRKGVTVSAAKAKKGKVQIHDMHFTKTIDKSSPMLMQK